MSYIRNKALSKLLVEQYVKVAFSEKLCQLHHAHVKRFYQAPSHSTTQNLEPGEPG